MKPIRVGIFGLNRGASHINGLLGNGAEIVAVCDMRTNLVEAVRRKLGEGVGYYESFNEIIEHDMDAVLLANYFHEHAPYAIRCLEKNIHVLSECTAAGTMADCVALVRAAGRSRASRTMPTNSQNPWKTDPLFSGVSCQQTGHPPFCLRKTGIFPYKNGKFLFTKSPLPVIIGIRSVLRGGTVSLTFSPPRRSNIHHTTKEYNTWKRSESVFSV